MEQLYHELQICWEKGWSYQRDWMAMGVEERARWLAFVGIEAWLYDLREERRRNERAVGAMR